MHEVERIEGSHGIVGRLFYDEDARDPTDMGDPMGKLWTVGKWRFDSRVFDSREELEEELENFKGVYAEMHVYSNRAMSGETMYVVVDRETIIKEYGAYNRWTKAKAQKYAEGEAKEWGQYFDGDVYGYIVSKGDEDLDSCWGFYGLDYATEELKNIVEYHESEEAKLDWKKEEFHI